MSEFTGLLNKLTQRSEEIVIIVEQVQTQYKLLEEEMRSLVEHNEKP